MTSQQFAKYLHDPGLVNDQSLLMLEDIVTRFPFCQSGQLLLARNYYVEENHQYPGQLKKAAAYAGDRRMLRELIGRTQKSVVGPQPITDDPAPAPVPVPTNVYLPKESAPLSIEFITPAYERLTHEELLAIVKTRLAEIEAEKNREQPVPGFHEHEHKPGPLGGHSPDAPVITTKASLIEKFILEEPRISKPKASFFSPSESAIRSNFDEEEIVSETLAQLYAKQGNIAKAIHIYQKLSLINQEKSRYFAAQIKNLDSSD